MNSTHSALLLVVAVLLALLVDSYVGASALLNR